jgi:hypothetical protein
MIGAMTATQGLFDSSELGMRDSLVSMGPGEFLSYVQSKLRDFWRNTQGTYVPAAQTYVAIGVGAAIWIAMAVCVAFPDQFGDLNLLYKKFFSDDSYPLTLVGLLFVDVVIALAFIKDIRVHNAVLNAPALITIIICTGAFVAISTYGERHHKQFMDSHSAVIVWIALGAIWLPRAITYGAPETFYSLKDTKSAKDGKQS